MSKVEALRQALRRLFTEHERDGMLPTSGRFLFYEFIQAAIIPKLATVARRADQNMNDALTSLREAARSRGLGSSTRRAASRGTRT
jgi:hypothetical protein